MADTIPATKAPTASPTEKKNLYTPRGAADQFSAGKYAITNYTYPADLYSNKKIYGGNYAIFYINVSTESKLIKEEKAITVEDFPARDRGDLVGMNLSPTQLAAANVGAGTATGAIGGGLLTGNIEGAIKGAKAGAGIGLVTGVIVAAQSSRTQKRLKTAIALHIPNNLSISYGVTYSDEDTGDFAMAAAVVKGGADMVKLLVQASGKDAGRVGSDLAKGVATYLALSKGPNQAANSVAAGVAANPKKEQVFKGVNFRTFSFDYKFFPRSSIEASAVLKIIKEFKYHMHPEFKDNNNLVYIYPSEFDIFYYKDGQENSNLHRNTSCVLTDMSINYTPNGMFSTFDDGMPTQIDVVLNFRELALLTKDKVKDGL